MYLPLSLTNNSPNNPTTQPPVIKQKKQVTNIGRDGVGGVMSCGQGSIWRVDVLRDGVTSDGKRGVDAMEVCIHV